MSRVFISHASEDRSAAEAVCAALEREGVPCWIAPRDVQLSSVPFPEQIIGAIREAPALVLLLSPHANASNYVLGEVHQAFDLNKPLLTVRLEEVEPDDGLRLYIGSSQWLNAWGRELCDVASTLAQSVANMVPTAISSGESIQPIPVENRASTPWYDRKISVKAALLGALLLGVAGYLGGRI